MRHPAAFFLGLLGLAGCEEPPRAQDCVDLWEGPLENHVQPYEVALDADARRVWSTSLAGRALVEIDADSGEELRTVLLADRPLAIPDAVVDAAGVVWIGSQEMPAVMRYDPATDTRREIAGLERVASMVPVGDGVALLGRIDGVRTIMTFDAAGAVVATRELEARGLVAHPDGLVALADDAIVLSTTLEELDRCALPFADAERGALLADGALVVSNLTHVGICDGEGWVVGVENKDVIPWEAGALVLDRIGPEDPNLGIARYVDATGVYDHFTTAKNTGFGALDPVTGLLWANSEGTSEMIAWAPDTGEVVHRVRTGALVDGIALHEGYPGEVYLTGRLSDTMARANRPKIEATSTEVHWPYSPVLDADRDRLWVLGQTAGVLYGVDPETLAVVESVDLGVGPNGLLTFGGVALHAERGTVLVVESAADTIYEIEPGAGVVNSWPLGGPLVEDPDIVGELLVRVDTETGDALVSRSPDGRVVRVDLDAGVRAQATFPVVGDDHMDLLRVFGTRGKAWFGASAFDPVTLRAAPDDDLPAVRLVGSVDDDWIVLADEGRSLVRLGEGGEVHGRLRVAEEDLHAAVFRMAPSGDAVWMGRSIQGVACRFGLEEIE